MHPGRPARTVDEGARADHGGDVSDLHLRELERRWRESGAREHEVAWIRARLRAGTLRPEQAELAAWCGHQGARAALDWSGGPELAVRLPARSTLAPEHTWADEIARRAGPEGVACALSAAARQSSWWAAEELQEEAARRVQPAVRALETWLRDPSPQALEGVSRASAGSAALVTALVGGEASLGPEAAPRLLDSLVAVLAIDRNGHSEPWRTHMEDAIRAALGAWALAEHPAPAEAS